MHAVEHTPLPELMAARLGYMPEPLPDELLYSWVARLHVHMGSPPMRLFLAAAFGHRDVRAAFDLPNHLAAFAERLPVGMRFTGEEIAMKFTLFPYFTAYSSPTKRQQALSAMLGRGAPLAHQLLGLPSFVVQVDHLRFCRSCHDLMVDERGEPYWRRSLQLASTVVCPDHEEPLRRSTVPTGQSGRAMFFSASVSTCPTGSPEIVSVSDAVVLDRLSSLARAGRDLLESPPEPIDTTERQRRYRRSMGILGFAPKAMQIYRPQLVGDLVRFWGGALDVWPELPSTNVDRPWPAMLIQRRDRSYHPLQHLLFTQFVAANFLKKPAPDLPFGPGPWACVNPLADHRGQQLVSACSVERKNPAIGTRGHFRCSCGFYYTRVLKADGFVTAPFRQDWGPLARAFLQQCKDDGVPLAAAARTLEINRGSIGIVARSVGVDFGTPRSIKPISGMKTRASVSNRKTVTAMAGSRSRQTEKVRLPRYRERDWRSLDEKLSRELPAALEDAMSVTPPKRVTAKALAAALDVNVNVIVQNLHRLPLTAAVWPSCVENKTGWDERRGEHVCDRLCRDWETLPRSERHAMLVLPGVRLKLALRRTGSVGIL